MTTLAALLAAWLLGLVMAGRYRGFLSLDTQDTLCGRIAAPVWWVTKLLYRWHPGPTGRRLNSRRGDEVIRIDPYAERSRQGYQLYVDPLVLEAQERQRASQTLRQAERNRATLEAEVRLLAGEGATTEELHATYLALCHRTPRP